jgi:hypothetical protein
MSNPIKLEAEQVLAEQVRILTARLADAELRASQAQAAANILAAKLSELTEPPAVEE